MLSCAPALAASDCASGGVCGGVQRASGLATENARNTKLSEKGRETECKQAKRAWTHLPCGSVGMPLLDPCCRLFASKLL
eukprot:350383-Chlamydomonas_euryale.AAC.3